MLNLNLVTWGKITQQHFAWIRNFKILKEKWFLQWKLPLKLKRDTAASYKQKQFALIFLGSTWNANTDHCFGCFFFYSFSFF